MRAMLGLEKLQEKDELVEMLNVLAEGGLLLESGHRLSKPDYLFTRIEDEQIKKQMDKLEQSKTMDTPKVQAANSIQYLEQKSEITIDEFVKMDLRTAKIVEAESVPKADKLLKLKIDLGYELRTVVSGIAQHYKPEEIIGKEILFLANLAPRTIRGIESKGMILLAENAEGKLNFVSPSEGWQPGSPVK